MSTHFTRTSTAQFPIKKRKGVGFEGTARPGMRGFRRRTQRQREPSDTWPFPAVLDTEQGAVGKEQGIGFKLKWKESRLKR